MEVASHYNFAAQRKDQLTQVFFFKGIILDKHHVGFVLSYHLPKYIRATTLKKALENNQNLIIHDAQNESRKFFRYFQTLIKVLRCSRKFKPDLWIVNFRGHEIFWFVRFIIGKKARIIFDEFVSPYDSLVNERKKISRNSIFAKVLYQIENSILNNSEYLWADTNSQAQHYAQLFNIPIVKFAVMNVAADEDLFSPIALPKKYEYSETFIVFTYATFIPLHGMDIILKAADILKELPIRFVIAGGKGKALDVFLKLKQQLELKNVSHISWIDYKDLPSYITGAQLCLGGPFGNTPQANRVITGKTIQFLACETPTLIGANEETAKFVDRENCLLVPQGDPVALAEAISWAYNNQEKLKQISRQGRLLYEEKFSLNTLRNKIKSFLDVIGYI